MGHNGQATSKANLEERLLEARRRQRRIHLEKKRPSSIVTGYGVLAPAFHKDLVPKVLGPEANAHGRMVFLGLGLKFVEGASDGLSRRDEESGSLVRGALLTPIGT